MTVWVVFIGAYSDRRAVAVFDKQDTAFTAADALLAAMEDSREHPEAVEIEKHEVQTIAIGARLDGGTYVYIDGKPWNEPVKP